MPVLLCADHTLFVDVIYIYVYMSVSSGWRLLPRLTDLAILFRSIRKIRYNFNFGLNISSSDKISRQTSANSRFFVKKRRNLSNFDNWHKCGQNTLGFKCKITEFRNLTFSLNTDYACFDKNVRQIVKKFCKASEFLENISPISFGEGPRRGT